MKTLHGRHRKDANHDEVAGWFEHFGFAVDDVSQTDLGYDMAVWWRSQGRCIEVKDGSKAPSARRLTAHEAKVSAERPDVYRVVECFDDVARVVNEMRGAG